MYEVVRPQGKKTVKVGSFAKRLDTLEGKTVGFLWDWVFRGDEVFPVVEKELIKRYPGIKIIGYEEFGTIHGVEEGDIVVTLPDRLKEKGVQAVITAVGC